jgi:hypothetical protein
MGYGKYSVFMTRNLLRNNNRGQIFSSFFLRFRQIDTTPQPRFIASGQFLFSFGKKCLPTLEFKGARQAFSSFFYRVRLLGNTPETEAAAAATCS